MSTFCETGLARAYWRLGLLSLVTPIRRVSDSELEQPYMGQQATATAAPLVEVLELAPLQLTRSPKA
jgi:hypothetical protein